MRRGRHHCRGPARVERIVAPPVFAKPHFPRESTNPDLPSPNTTTPGARILGRDLADIVYTSASPAGTGLTLRTRGAAAFANPSTGEVAISEVTIDLPARSVLTPN